MRTTSWLPLLLGPLLTFQPLNAVASPTTSSALQASIRAYAQSHGFNGTVLVAQRGARHLREQLWSRRSSIQNAGDQRYPLSRDVRDQGDDFVLILQLFEAGKLDLDGRLQTYLPDFRGEGGDQITVQSLLNHTSGIPQLDVAKTHEDASRLGLPMYERLQSSKEMVDRYCTGKLRHPIGTIFDYNNCDYLILGRIIENITGSRYEDVLHQRILSPLGMRDSGIRYQKEVIERLASSYYLSTPSGPLVNDPPLYNENLSAAGAMYSTAEDLLKFSEALFGGRLIKPSTLALMLTPGLDEYGDGVWIRSFGPQKLRMVERYGKSSGMNTLLAVFPDQHVAIILMTNTEETNLSDFRNEIARQVALP